MLCAGLLSYAWGMEYKECKEWCIVKDSNVSTKLTTLSRIQARYTTLNQHSSVYWLMTSFVRFVPDCGVSRCAATCACARFLHVTAYPLNPIQ